MNLHAIGLALSLHSPHWSQRLVQDSCAPSTRVGVPDLGYSDDDNRLRDPAGLQELDSTGATPLPLHRHR